MSRVGVWSCVVNHMMERFVEAFSRVKKCTVPGRGLMTLDVGQLYSRAIKIGPVPPGALIHDKAYADGYIAAFYLDHESDVLQWILKNKQLYPLRHMRALVRNGIAAVLKKKQLADVMAAIDAMYLLPPDAPAGGAGGTGGVASVAAAVRAVGAATGGGAQGGAGSSV